MTASRIRGKKQLTLSAGLLIYTTIKDRIKASVTWFLRRFIKQE
jgi:hypothetical protein